MWRKLGLNLRGGVAIIGGFRRGRRCGGKCQSSGGHYFYEEGWGGRGKRGIVSHISVVDPIKRINENEK